MNNPLDLLNPALQIILQLSLHASLIVFAILTIQFALGKRLSARWRYAVWGIVVARLLIPWNYQIPVVSKIVYTEKIETVSPAPVLVEEPPASQPAPLIVSELLEESIATYEAVPASAIPIEASIPVEAFTLPDPATLLAVLWLLGALLIPSTILINHRRMIRRAMTSSQTPPPWVLDTLEAARKEIGMTTCPTIHVTPEVHAPTLVGALRPKILLPQNLIEDASPEEMRLFLLHELTHLKTGDIWFSWLWCIALSLHWFNPLLWWTGTRIRRDRELACDESVLRQIGPDAKDDYARALLKAVSHITGKDTQRYRFGLAGIAENKSEMTRRVTSILTPIIRSRRLRIISALTLTTILIASFIQLVPTQKIVEGKEPLFENRKDLSKKIRQLEEQLDNLAYAVRFETNNWNPDTEKWESAKTYKESEVLTSGIPHEKLSVHFTDQVLRWIGGQSPYSREKFHLAYNGEYGIKADYEYGSLEKLNPDYRAEITEARPEQLVHYRNDIGLNYLLNHTFEKESLADALDNIHYRTKIEEGQFYEQYLIKVDVSGYKALVRRLYLDPAKNFAIVRRQRVDNAKRDEPEQGIVYDSVVKEFQQVGEFWFPIHIEILHPTYDERHTLKFKNYVLNQKLPQDAYTVKLRDGFWVNDKRTDTRYTVGPKAEPPFIKLSLLLTPEGLYHEGELLRDNTDIKTFLAGIEKPYNHYIRLGISTEHISLKKFRDTEHYLRRLTKEFNFRSFKDIGLQAPPKPQLTEARNQPEVKKVALLLTPHGLLYQGDEVSIGHNLKSVLQSIGNPQEHAITLGYSSEDVPVDKFRSVLEMLTELANELKFDHVADSGLQSRREYMANLPDHPQAHAARFRASCANNLKQLGLVMKMFANEAKGERFPKPNILTIDQEGVYPKFLADPNVLMCPTQPHTPNQILSDADKIQSYFDHSSYWYLGHATTNEENGQFLLDEYRKTLSDGDGDLSKDIHLPGSRNRSTEILFRIREGIERFFITDINDPSAGNKAASTIPILIEKPGHHNPHGGNVLFLDGHVEYLPYPGKFPMTKAFIEGLQALDDLPEKTETTAKVPNQNNYSFVVTGTVSDASGKPMPGVIITAHTGAGTLRETGFAITENDGTYTMEFRTGNYYKNETTGNWGVGIQAAHIRVKKSGYYEQNMSRQGGLRMAASLVDIENSTWATPENTVLDGKPFHLDFVMVPAAQISGRLVDKQGNPLPEQKLSISEMTLPQGNVLANIETNSRGRFKIGEIPLSTLWFEISGLRSQPQNYTEPKAYKVDLIYDPSRSLVSDPAVYAWQNDVTYTPPNFNAYFPENGKGHRELVKLWRAKDKDDRSDTEILDTVRNGLRNQRNYGTQILRWIGNKYIWNQSPQNPYAVEIMYHATDINDTTIAGFRGTAIYFGLSVVRPKTTPIMHALVNIAMNTNDPNDLHRIAWGASSQKEELLAHLKPYLESDDEAIRANADVRKRIFLGELKAFEWATEQAKIRAEKNFAHKLPEIKNILANGDTATRYNTLDLIMKERIYLIMDDSFIDAFAKCVDERNLKIPRTVAIVVGENWIWNAENQNTRAIDLLLQMTKSRDRDTRNNAVYHGLSTVREKDDTVIRRLLEMAFLDRDPNLYGRVAWGLKAHQHKTARILQQYIQGSDPTQSQHAREVYKDMTGQAYDPKA